MTLYLFTKDERDLSNCSGGGAQSWPPLLTVGDPTGGEGIAGDKLGNIERTDGSMQVTYNGWPLYYFARDVKPGDANGQTVGNVWWVVSTSGSPIQTNAMVNTAEHPELGTILADASGRTVYLFTRDEKDLSNCSGGCAQSWPPLLTIGDPSPGESISAARLGTITRDDGSVQVTYNGWPLYYFANDQKPGDTNGMTFSPVWCVVETDVEPVGTKGMAPEPTATPTETPEPTATPTPTPTVEPTPASEGIREIRVATTGSLTFDSNSIKVQPGETVKFIVTNTSSFFHTFTIATSSAKQEILADVSLGGGKARPSPLSFPRRLLNCTFSASHMNQ